MLENSWMETTIATWTQLMHQSTKFNTLASKTDQLTQSLWNGKPHDGKTMKDDDDSKLINKVLQQQQHRMIFGVGQIMK